MKKALVCFVGFASLALGHYAVLGRPLERFHLDNVNNQLRVEEAQNQEKQFPGKVGAERAVTLALRSFLNDGSHIESPLNLAVLLAMEEMNASIEEASSPAVIKKAREILYFHFNQYTSEIRFMSVDEQPEHGETVDKNWIIRLKIPTLSDHIFWAVVDREGKICPYNYGFN